MNKNTINIISVCIVSLIIAFVFFDKNKKEIDKPSNITVSENNESNVKSDQYQNEIMETIVNENIKNFEKFSNNFKKNSSDNLTDTFSKDVFNQYIKYNASGEIDKNEILNITQNVLKNKDLIENPTIRNDIKTVPSNINNLRIYGNEIAMVQEGFNRGVISLEDKKNKAPYIANIYKTTAELLIMINVPEYLSDNHINLINGLKKYSEGLNMMEYQNTDPAKAILGLNKVKNANTEILKSFEKIKKTIILNKINYSEKDPGYFWVLNNENNETIKLE